MFMYKIIFWIALILLNIACIVINISKQKWDVLVINIITIIICVANIMEEIK